MPSCPRDNDTPLNCEHGCCGSSDAQKCCSFEVSETLIIIASVVGALIVFSGVIILIYCIASKKKDAVTPISTPRRRPPRNREADLTIISVVGALIVFSGVIILIYCIASKKKDAVTPISTPRRRPPRNREASKKKDAVTPISTPRRRPPRNREVAHRRRIPIMVEMPKPPPYSEAPPEYNSWIENNDLNRNDPNIPSHDINGTHQGAPSRSREARSSRSRDPRRSPLPSTSGAVSVISNRRMQSQSDIYVAFRTHDVESRSTQYNRSRNDSHSRNEILSINDESKSRSGHKSFTRNHTPHDQNNIHRSNSHRAVTPAITNTRPSNAHARDINQSNTNTSLPGGIASISGSPPPTNAAAALRSAKRRAVLLQLERRRTRHRDLSSDEEN